MPGDPQTCFVLALAAMNSSRGLVSLAAGAAIVMAASLATAQQFVTKAPTPADWAALSKLPDLNGVWERGGGGGAGGGAARGGAAPGGAGPARGGAAGAPPR